MCKISPISKQFLAIVSCNLLIYSLGNLSGWVIINFIELQSEKSTFPSGPLKLEEVSLVASISSIGGFLGNFVALPIIHRFGIKGSIHLCSVPIILSSLLIVFAQNVYYLFFSRMLCGLTAGVLAVGLPSFVMSISDDKVRGTLNSLIDPFSNMGAIVSFALGNYFTWRDQAKTQLIAPAIAAIILFFLPESPEYWTNRNQEKLAIEAHKFYRGSIADLEQVGFLQKLKEENNENGKLDDEISSESKLCLRDFLTPHAKRAFFVSFVGFILSYCSGSSMILSFSTVIFTKTGSLIPPKNSAILVSVIQIAANLSFLNIVDRFNRRTLFIYSSIIVTSTFFVYATYCFVWINQPEYQWIPTVCFGLIVFCSCIGQLPIPSIVSTEIFPKKIRQTSLAVSNSMLWIVIFLVSSIFPIFLEEFGPFICMSTFSVICVISLVFHIIFLPETRGKSHEEIAKMMSK